MRSSTSFCRSFRRQRGTALLSALAAFLVVSVGMLALVRAQSQLRHDADLARDRSDAMRLAQADLERLRAAGWDAIADADLDATPAGSPTRYALARRIAAGADDGWRAVAITVAWRDRRGAAQQLRVASAIARHDPAYAGTLGLPRHGRPVGAVHGRHASIPLAATALGDGRSAMKLSAAGTQAAVFDDATGAVTALCGVAAGRRNADLTAADLERCEARHGRLVRGAVRFAAGGDRPLSFDVAVAPESVEATAPICGVDRHEADAGEGWASYACVVAPSGSDRAALVPAGWTVGRGAGQYRVCRYAAVAPLRQNFVVVAGLQDCPEGSADNRADAATVPPRT